MRQIKINKDIQLLSDVEDDFSSYRKLLYACLIQLSNDIKLKSKRPDVINYLRQIQSIIDGEMFAFICMCLKLDINKVRSFFKKKLPIIQTKKSKKLCITSF